jgi:hypothetical protein
MEFQQFPPQTIKATNATLPAWYRDVLEKRNNFYAGQDISCSLRTPRAIIKHFNKPYHEAASILL